MQGFQVINGDHVGTILISEDGISLTVLKSNHLPVGASFGTDYLATSQFKTVPVTGSDTSKILNEKELDLSMDRPELHPLLSVRLG